MSKPLLGKKIGHTIRHKVRQYRTIEHEIRRGFLPVKKMKWENESNLSVSVESVLVE